MSIETNQLVEVRNAKREQLIENGHNPYPASVGRTHSLKQIRDEFDNTLEVNVTTEVEVTIAGRVMFARNSGKLCFATLQEGDGTRLQVMLSRDEVGTEELSEWKKLVDLGDFVAITGFVATSMRGELSVRAKSWKMASKALNPLPVLHKELSEENQTRLRYVDMITRDEARDMVRTRAKVVSTMRRYFEDDDFIEVETPMLNLVHGGAKARPFTTHMNAFDQNMSLRIALELGLKKAVVGGVEKVFEMGRVFRNEGVDSTHSPEFTMLEAYEAYGDMFTMANRTREMIQEVASKLGVTSITTRHGHEIDLFGNWEWLSVYEGVSRAVGVQITSSTDEDTVRAAAVSVGLNVDKINGADKIVMEILDELVEPTLINPTYLHSYPASAQPLARRSETDPGVVAAWDLIIGGMEVATAFSELIDPVVQRAVLTEQSLAAAAGDAEAMVVDEDFLNALAYGAPPMGGLGVGVDRLLMLFTGTGIRDTLLFPHTRG